MANEPSGDIVEDMLPIVASAESSGDADASNPNSSATGLLQFTDPTWNRLLQNYPNQGLTAEGKNDPEQQKQAFRLLAKNEYIPALTKMGQSVSAPNIYAMHVLGQPSATALMQASPDTPASEAVGADNWRNIQQNNPSLFGEDGNITSGQALAAVGSHLIGATGQSLHRPALMVTSTTAAISSCHKGLIRPITRAETLLSQRRPSARISWTRTLTCHRLPGSSDGQLQWVLALMQRPMAGR